MNYRRERIEQLNKLQRILTGREPYPPKRSCDTDTKQTYRPEGTPEHGEASLPEDTYGQEELLETTTLRFPKITKHWWDVNRFL